MFPGLQKSPTFKRRKNGTMVFNCVLWLESKHIFTGTRPVVACCHFTLIRKLSVKFKCVKMASSSRHKTFTGSWFCCCTRRSSRL